MFSFLFTVILWYVVLFTFDDVKELDPTNTFTILDQKNYLQVVRFTAIFYYFMHRLMRPADRFDPMRTILD